MSPVRVPVVQDVLSTASGALAGAGAAVQLFATPKALRNTVFIAHTGNTGAMYIGFTNDVSATKHAYKMAAGDAPVSLNLSPQVDVWVKPDATGNDYTAHEMRIR